MAAEFDVRGQAPERVRLAFDYEKRAITRRANESFGRGNKRAGLEMAREYRDTFASLIDSWHTAVKPAIAPESRLAIVGYGSIPRGEGSFFSDLDLAVCVERVDPQAPYNELRHSLYLYLHKLELFPETSIWFPHKSVGNPVIQEQMHVASVLAGDPSLLPEVRGNDEANFNTTEKALHSIFETLKPPPFANTDEHDVFNIKHDQRGGMNNFMVIRAIGQAYGGTEIDTVGHAKTLVEHGILDEQDVEALGDSLSAFLIYRNLMHIYADGMAERMGARTREFIVQNIPQLGTADELRDRIEETRDTVHGIMKKAVRGFLRDQGLPEELYERLPTMTKDDRLDIIENAADPRVAQFVAWSSHEPEVLEAALDRTNDYSTFLAIARTRDLPQELYKRIEQSTRTGFYADYTRRMLAVNPSVDLEILPDVYKSNVGETTRNKVKKRAAEALYEGVDMDPELQQKLKTIIFYPDDIATWRLFLTSQGEPGNMIDWVEGQTLEDYNKITPGKVYINFAGRLAHDKNFLAYIALLESLHKQGVDFEAHVYGVLAPDVMFGLRNFWMDCEDPTVARKIVYHGKYDKDSLQQDIDTMKERGSPLFVFPKGLVTQELILAGVPVVTTIEGNKILRETGVTQFEEYELAGLAPLAAKFRGLIPAALQQDTEAARQYLLEHFGYEAWGDKLAAVFTGLSDERHITLSGTSPLQAPHGPATWSRHVIDAMHDRSITTTYEDNTSFNARLNRLSSDPLIDAPEVAEDHEWFSAFGTFIDTVLKYTRRSNLPPEAVTEGVDALLRLAQDPQTVEKLATKQAETFFHEQAERFGISPLAIHYPSMAFDQLDSSDRLRNLHFKLARWISFLQDKPPVTDGTQVTYGEVIPLAAIRDKIEHGTPFVHVDHVLATESSLVRRSAKRYITHAEDQWLTALSAFERQATMQFVDKYIALWPTNERMAKVAGIPEENIHYIPNAIKQ